MISRNERQAQVFEIYHQMIYFIREVQYLDFVKRKNGTKTAQALIFLGGLTNAIENLGTDIDLDDPESMRYTLERYRSFLDENTELFALQGIFWDFDYFHFGQLDHIERLLTMLK